MPRSKMTDAYRTQMRNQILDKAHAILVDKGPANISSRAIAHNLTLTHMGLFTYFSNQGAILEALAEREQAPIVAQMRVIGTRVQTEGVDKVVEEGLEYLQKFARNEPNLFRLAWMEPGSDDRHRQPSWLQPTADLLAEIIQKGINQDIFQTHDAHIAAILVIGLVNMPFVLAYGGKIQCTEEREKLSQEAVAAAMQYLRTGSIANHPRINNLPDWLTRLRGWFGKIL